MSSPKNHKLRVNMLATVFMLTVFFVLGSLSAHASDTLWIENFEAGWGSWWVNGAQWEVGTAIYGPPDTAWSGVNCAGTVLNGSYTEPACNAGSQTSRLISPPFVVPSDNPRLRFYHWFNFSWNDYGLVEIRVNGGAWTTLSGTYRWYGSRWTRPSLDLSAYVDSLVEVAFRITTENNYSSSTNYCDADVAAGWYVDDICVETGSLEFPELEDFELSLGDWWSSTGMWQVGTPTSGPASAYSGDSCAGTVLSGNYTEPPCNAGSQSSYLVSPPFIVPSDNPRLRFYHWYSFSWDDNGRVQIRVNGGSWVTISSTYTWKSVGWSRPSLDLSAYADSIVEIAFRIATQNNYSSSTNYCNSDVSSGWYVDDVIIEHGPIVFNNPEDFEFGQGDWWTDAGMWQIGTPTSGPGSAYSGDSCAGTVLSSNYTEPACNAGSQSSRLISPPFVVPSNNPRLRFYHWFNFSWNDYGLVEIRVNGGAWTTLSGTYRWYGSRWTRPSLDLSAYIDSTVEVAFRITTENNYSSHTNYCSGDVNTGWYIDDVCLETGAQVFTELEDFELGLGDWWSSTGMWQVGEPTSGPGKAFSGDSCAATVINGNYTEPACNGGSQTSYLVSPPFVVPPDNPRLRYYHWYSFSWSDYGLVVIRVNGGSWEILSGTYYWNSSRWTRPSLDLSAYADSTVEIAFRITTQNDYSSHTNYCNSDVSSGWYIDDITIEHGPLVFNNPEDFEFGQGDWWADAGMWQVGNPTSGPGSSYSGDSCAGTVLSGNYTEPACNGGSQTSRMISPPYVVPSDNSYLRFYHWYNFSWNDNGRVQLRVNGGSWVTLSSVFSSSSGTWTPYQILLNDYVDSTIEIGFLITTENNYSSSTGYCNSDVGPGWYIDDFRIIVPEQPPILSCPSEAINITVCDLDVEIAQFLKIYYADSVDAGGADWAEDTLRFTPGSEGAHNFTVIATNDYGADTCEVTVNVTQEIEMTVDKDNLTFNMKEGGELPDPKTIYIDSPCESGVLDWDVYIFNAGYWLSVDKTSGTNPDSLIVSITDSNLTEGIHTGLLKFIDPTAANSPIFVNISLFVESGVDVGDYYAEKGETFKVPVNLYTLDSLEAFTIPLKNGTLQPDKVTLDSIVVDSAFRDLVGDSLDIVFDEDSTTGTICLRPMQPPLPPDTINAYKVADMYYSVAPTADDEMFDIDTTTVTVGVETFSYQFVKSTGETVIPAFNKGTVYIGQLDTVTIADVTCPENEPIGVPVTTTGIENIAGVQLYVGYDTMIVESYGDLVTSKYFTPTKNDTDGIVYVTWANQATPFDVPDGDTLMTLWFKAVGHSGEVAPLSFLSGSKLVDNLGNTIYNIYYDDGSISLTAAAFDISGNMMLCRDMSKKLYDVEIALTGSETHSDTTGLNGRFYFEDLVNGSFTVTPSREADENDESFGIEDVVIVQRYLADLEDFTACQMVGADVTVDCDVSIADVVKMLRALAQIEPLPSGDWKFVDSTYALDEVSWCSAPGYKDITYSGAAVDDASFLGIRMGDVTGDWGSVFSMPFAKGVTAADAEVVLALGKPVVDDESLMKLPLTMSSADPVAGLSMRLEYDYEHLEFVGVESSVLKGVISNESNNDIYVVWADVLKPVNGEQVAAELVFRLKDEVTTVVSPTFVDITAVDEKGQPLLSSGVSDGDSDGLDIILPETFALHQNYPNPFNPSTTIELALPTVSDYRLTIYNITGQVVREFVGHGGPGTVEIIWDGRSTGNDMAASGVYLYRVQARSFVKTRKMLLLK